MATIQKLFTSYQPDIDGNTYVGQNGRLWFDDNTKSLRYSDGVTPGGVIVAGSGSSSAANIVIKDEGNILTNTASSINFVGNNISAAAVGNDVVVTITGSEIPLYIQDTQPTDTNKYQWIQTNIGVPGSFTIWFNDGV